MELNNYEDVKKAIEQIRASRPILNEIEQRSESYQKALEDEKVDDHILFELEVLQQKLTKILYAFYLGDIEREYNKGMLSIEEKKRLSTNTYGKAGYDWGGPFFSFGYMTSSFIDKLKDDVINTAVK